VPEVILTDGDSAKSGAVSAAVGGAVGGFAALAALLLLLFLFNKKRGSELIEQGVEMQDPSVDTTIDVPDFISEYGLSEGAPPSDDDDNGVDLPLAQGEAGYYESDDRNASENNPEELDEYGIHPDES
jgi:hypothetical protein